MLSKSSIYQCKQKKQSKNLKPEKGKKFSQMTKTLIFIIKTKEKESFPHFWTFWIENQLVILIDQAVKNH